MKAILYQKGGRENAIYTDVPEPVPGDHDVLIRVYASNICRPADMAHDGGYSSFGRYPLIPGHEYAGIVEAVGKDVTQVAVGDRVTAEPNIACGKCYYCKRGQEIYCENFEAVGQTQNGGFAELVKVDESLVYKIPDGVSMRQASMTELSACVFNCMERCDFDYSSEVLIMGCGGSGTILTQMVRHSNVASVVVIDSVQSKLDNIAKIGVDTVLVDRDNYEAHEAVLKEKYPHGFDYIIDCTGDYDLISRSVPMLKKGGTFVNYAFQNNRAYKKKVQIDPLLFVTRELNYIGTTALKRRYDLVLKAIESGKVDPEIAITKVLPLDKFFEGLDMVINDPETIKVCIEPNGPSEGK